MRSTKITGGRGSRAGARLTITTLLTATLAGCGLTPQHPGPIQRHHGDYALIDNVPTVAPDIQMAHPAIVRRVIREGQGDNRVMDHLTTLTQEFGPRLTGSTSCENSAAWAADRFRAWGLSNVHLDHWGDIAVRFDRGPSTGAIYAPSRRSGEARKVRDIPFTTLSWTPGTDGPARGPVVRMPESEGDFDADAIKGAWVLVPEAQSSDRRGIRSVGFLMRERIKERHDIRAGATDPHTGEPIAASGDAPAGAHWAGSYEYSGSKLPVWLTLDNLDSGSPTGTLSIPGFHTGDISDATYDADSGDLAFKWKHSMGVSSLTLNVDGDTAKGQSVGGSGAVYPVELTFNPGADAPTADQGDEQPDEDAEREARQAAERESRRAVLAMVLGAEPLGFISSSRDEERVWTTAKSDWRTIELADYEQDVEVNIRSVDYDYVNSRVTDGQPVELEFDLNHTLTAGPIACHNVMAEIPGSLYPDEAVIVSAHLDSWDGPGSEGSIDNGTGSAVVMEAARLLMATGVQPKRTIRFALWTGEEQGLLGSKAYVDTLSESELDKLSAAFVDDGGTNYEGGLPAADFMVPYLAAATAPLNNRFFSQPDYDSARADDDPDNDSLAGYLNINIRPTGDKIDTHRGSDHAAFNAKGVPGFFWDEVGRADYRAAWHTQRDTLDKAIPEYLEQSATVMAVTAFQLADAPSRLPRSAEEAGTSRLVPAAAPEDKLDETVRDEGWMRVERMGTGG